MPERAAAPAGAASAASGAPAPSVSPSASATTVEPGTFHGQPCVRLHSWSGASAVVLLHGAQVVSWVPAGGSERCYLSPQALFDGVHPVRGGTPVCFPQFSHRGPLPKHGFARQQAWEWLADPSCDGTDAAAETGPAGPDPAVAEPPTDPNPAAEVPAATGWEAPAVIGWEADAATGGSPDACATLRLRDSAATRALWPCAFELRLQVALGADTLRIALEVRNTGGAAWSFTAALHSYLHLRSLAAARLHGLEGAPVWDGVRDARGTEAHHPLAFTEEFDRVYTAPGHALQLREPGGGLRITQSPSFADTVVWNPGAALCATFKDMPADGYRQMLCVEAACAEQPVHLAPGARWHGWQALAAFR